MTDRWLSRRGAMVLAVVVGTLLAVAGAGLGVGGAERARAATTVAVKDCFGNKIQLLPQEKRLLFLHNETRTEKGLSRLCVHPKLQKAAREHTRDMMARDYFNHITRGSGLTPGQRMHRAGYRWSSYGENIGWAHASAANPNDVFGSWKGSAVHRKTLLRGRWREVGIGWVKGDFDPKGGPVYRGAVMSTVDFGVR